MGLRRRRAVLVMRQLLGEGLGKVGRLLQGLERGQRVRDRVEGDDGESYSKDQRSGEACKS